jgi:hypothetical protein
MATAASATTTCQRHGRGGQANGCNSQRDHCLSQHLFSIQDVAPSTNPQMATVLVRSHQLPAAQFVLPAVSAKARLEKAEASLNVIANTLQARVRKAR